jgi:N-acetylneuraminic acid mutarotase
MRKTIAFIIIIMTEVNTTLENSCAEQPNTIPPVVITEGPSLPRGRGGHAAASLDGHVFVAGGTDWSSDHTTKSWLCDSAVLIDNSWQPGPALPHPVAYGMFASDKTGIYLAGGCDDANKLTTVYHLDNCRKGSSWHPLSSLPVAVTSGSAALLNGKLYVACGWAYPDAITDQMWSLDVTDPKAKWTACQNLPGPKRAFPAMVACAQSLYLFGGMSPDPNRNSSGVMRDVYQYKPDKGSWLRLKDMPWPGYAWSGCSIDENHIILAGKADGKVHKDIFLIDVRDMTVQKIGEAVIQTTTAPLIKIRPDEFWLIAGEPDSNKNRTNRITCIRLQN